MVEERPDFRHDRAARQPCVERGLRLDARVGALVIGDQRRHGLREPRVDFRALGVEECVELAFRNVEDPEIVAESVADFLGEPVRQIDERAATRAIRLQIDGTLRQRIEEAPRGVLRIGHHAMVEERGSEQRDLQPSEHRRHVRVIEDVVQDARRNIDGSPVGR